METNIWNFDHS